MTRRLVGRVVLAVALTAIAASLLVFASRSSLSAERAMKADADRLVSDLGTAPLRTLEVGGFAEARAILDGNENSRIGVVAAPGGRVTRVAYFRGRLLVAIDRLDERGDTIRRDYMDELERVRIRMFYGNSSEYLAHYLDAGGRVVRVETLGPVPIGVRPTYGG